MDGWMDAMGAELQKKSNKIAGPAKSVIATFEEVRLHFSLPFYVFYGRRISVVVASDKRKWTYLPSSHIWRRWRLLPAQDVLFVFIWSECVQYIQQSSFSAARGWAGVCFDETRKRMLNWRALGNFYSTCPTCLESMWSPSLLLKIMSDSERIGRGHVNRIVYRGYFDRNGSHYPLLCACLQLFGLVLLLLVIGRTSPRHKLQHVRRWICDRSSYTFW